MVTKREIINMTNQDTQKKILPKIQVVFCTGFVVVSRQDDEEYPVGHVRFPTWQFPFRIGWEMFTQYLRLKHKYNWEK